MAAVRYDDIERIYICKKSHVDWDGGPNNSLSRAGGRSYRAYKSAKIFAWFCTHDTDYFTYQLIVISKNHRKIKMCDVTYIDPEITDFIMEKTGLEADKQS